LIEEIGGNRPVAELACFLLRETLDHPAQKCRRTVHPCEGFLGPEDVGRHWLSSSFSSLPALKNGTFLAGTVTVVPVFGLRPSFIRRERSRKLPKPRISVLSPFWSELRMLLKMVLTTIST